MGKRFLSVLMILVAYLAPMFVGLSLSYASAVWLFVPLLFTLILFADIGVVRGGGWTSATVMVFGIVLAAALIFLTNVALLWGSVAMLGLYWIFERNSVFIREF